MDRPDDGSGIEAIGDAIQWLSRAWLEWVTWCLKLLLSVLRFTWEIMRGFDYGNVPDWIAALGTVGAFAVALYIYGRDLELRRQAQAWLVYAETVAMEILDPGRKVPKRFSRDSASLLDYCDANQPLLEQPHGSKDFITKTSVRITKVRISNKGDTAVPFVTGELVVAGKPLPNSTFGPVHGLGPNSKQDIVIVATRHIGSLFLFASPRLSFRDSTGYWWIRQSTLAPQPDLSASRNRSALALIGRTLSRLVRQSTRATLRRRRR